MDTAPIAAGKGTGAGGPRAYDLGPTRARRPTLTPTERPLRGRQALLADEVDFAITTEVPRDEAFACEPVVSSERGVMARPDHPVMKRSPAGRAGVAWRDLRQATILLPDQQPANFARIEEAVRDGWERKSGERLAQPVRFQAVPLT